MQCQRCGQRQPPIIRRLCLDARTTLAGIDAEWQPGHRSATLCQVAVCSDTNAAAAVFLLDLIALPRKTAAAALADVLRCPTLLKVGFQVQHDLSALGARLGPSCRRAQPLVDLCCGTFLSLAAHVSATLGSTLDKSQQRSDWAARPLTDEQRTYAALDAYCLLALYRAAPRAGYVRDSTTDAFVCDVMLEGLARQLRTRGIDAASAPLQQGPRHRVQSALVEAAVAEGRVLLTADRALALVCGVEHVLVRSTTSGQQLQELLGGGIKAAR